MPLGFSAFTEHQKCPQKFRLTTTTPARAKWQGTLEHHSFYENSQKTISASLGDVILLLGFP